MGFSLFMMKTVIDGRGNERTNSLGGLFLSEAGISRLSLHAAARAGSQVTVLHRGPRPLALFDPDLVERTRELGVDVHLGTEAIGIEESSGELIVRDGDDCACGGSCA